MLSSSIISRLNRTTAYACRRLQPSQQETHVSSFLSLSRQSDRGYSWMKRAPVTTEKPSSSAPTLASRSRPEISSWGRISRKVM